MSMNLIRAEQLIHDTWCQVFNYHDSPELDPNLALHFQLRLDVENHGYEKDGNTHHKEWAARHDVVIHVVVTNRHRCYVAVVPMGTVTDVDKIDPRLFQNTSNHDSCWRTDGLRVFHEQVQEAWEKCFAHVPEEHQPPNWYSMNFLNTWGDGWLSSKPISFVRITRAPHDDPEVRRDGYHDKLSKVEKVKFKIVIENGKGA